MSRSRRGVADVRVSHAANYDSDRTNVPRTTTAYDKPGLPLDDEALTGKLRLLRQADRWAITTIRFSKLFGLAIFSTFLQNEYTVQRELADAKVKVSDESLAFVSDDVSVQRVTRLGCLPSVSRRRR